jgi:lysophospholipase L1-like esterase
MNTNPSAIKVLCYGDSNTWGQKPDKSGRYNTDVRWTGVLQKRLGNGYYVIEEGLGSRTTDLDYSQKPGRNGRKYFVPCLASHTPLDIVIIMLGTNDLKMEYRRSADEIGAALEGMIGDVKTYAQNRDGKTPKVILISPIGINSNAPRFAEFYTGYYDNTSMEESNKLAGVIENVADRNGCLFLDAASVSMAGEDGIHFHIDSEEPLARLIYDTITETES